VKTSTGSKNAVFLIISYVFSSTKLEKGAEQVLPGSQWGGGRKTGGEMAPLFINV
jgi:hypothetical protein